MFLLSFIDRYVAVIGDIIESKNITDRSEFQKRLKAVLDRINDKYTDEIASNFMITLGDEFQGLLKAGKDTLKIILEIESAVQPIRLRFGVGIGKIDTDINRDIPLGADGPAYHNARKMIESLKANEKKYETGFANIMISSHESEIKGMKHESEINTAPQNCNDNIDTLLNTILSLCSTIKSKWTRRQTEIINCYFENGKNQYKTAKKLKITQSSVNKALIISNFYTYQNSIDTVNSVLSGIRGKDDV